MVTEERYEELIKTVKRLQKEIKKLKFELEDIGEDLFRSKKESKKIAEFIDKRYKVTIKELVDKRMIKLSVGRALIKNGVFRLGDLNHLTITGVYKLQGIGRKSLIEVILLANKNNMKISSEEDEEFINIPKLNIGDKVIALYDEEDNFNNFNRVQPKSRIKHGQIMTIKDRSYNGLPVYKCETKVNGKTRVAYFSVSEIKKAKAQESED